MQINVKLSPDVLDWVMAHIQQENVPRDVVKYLTIWKSGEKLPTFNQIEKVSKASGIPFGYFFLQEPPKEEFPLLEYRTIDSTSAMNPSRNIIDVMHDMEQVQDWARNHAIEEEQQAPEFIGSQKNNVDTEDFAEYVRTVLELEIKWYENSKSAVESFKTLRDKISQAGVIVMMSGIVGNNTHRPLDINEFRAFAMVDAHICIGNNSLYNDRYSSGTRVSKAESVSNAVAAEILVPQVMFEKKWKEIDKFDDPIKTIDALTKYFSCGTTVIARKALDNGYIDYSVYRKLSQIAVNRYNEKRKKEKEQGGGGDYYRTAASRIDTRFFKSLVSSVHEGKTLYTDAFRLTNTNRSTFENLVNKMGGGSK